MILNADGTRKTNVIKSLKGAPVCRGVGWISNDKIVFTDGKTISTINIDGTGQEQIFPKNLEVLNK